MKLSAEHHRFENVKYLFEIVNRPSRVYPDTYETSQHGHATIQRYA